MNYEVVETRCSPEIAYALELVAHAEALLLDAMPPEQRDKLIALQVRYERESDRALLGL